MASFIYDAFIDNLIAGNFKFNTTTQVFKITLVDTNYVINGSQIAQTNPATQNTAAANAKANHNAFDDIVEVSNNTAPNNGTLVVNGGSYVAGGLATTVSLASGSGSGSNITQDQQTINFTTVTWQNATIKANGAVLYASTDTAGSTPATSSQFLVAYLDFSQQIQSFNGNFAVTIDTGLKFLNPKNV